MLKQNPLFNTRLPESATNQRYIFDQPQVINPQTGQLSSAVFKKGTEVGFSAEPATPGMGVMTPADLTPVTPLKVETPIPTPVPSIANLPKPLPPPTPTPATDLTSQLEALQAEVLGAPAGKALKVSEATAGYQKQLDELNAQIAMHQANALERQEAALATGETLGFAAGEATRVARTDAIEAMKLSALAQAMQGNILTATKLAETASDAKYADKEKELKAARNNIIANWDSFTAAEKKRAEATLASIDAEDAFVKEQKEARKEIYNISTTAAQFGAPTDVLQRLQSARSPQEALQIAGYYLGAEFRQNVEEKNFQRSLQEAQYNLSVEKFREDMRQYNEQYAFDRHKEELARIQAKIQAADAAGKDQIATQEKAEVLQTKLNLIGDLLTHSGLDSRVGPKWIARTAFDIRDIWGTGQDFAGGVHQLVQKETIDTLINLKARGGTLGALSDQERILLQQAATKIGSWERLDDAGNGKGVWNIDEKSFKKELTLIQDLAKKALARVMGTQPLSFSEQTEINLIYEIGTANTTPQLPFSPINYY